MLLIFGDTPMYIMQNINHRFNLFFMKISKYNTIALLILGMLVASCTKNTPVLPIADFSASSLAIRTDSAVNFTDESTGNPTSWSWSFQGGTPATSTLQHPTNIQYHAVGTYSVTLTVTNADGSNTKTKSAYITVTEITPILPTVSTAVISNISDTSATSGGIISDIGSSPITARGVCWSTVPNPTIADNKTADGVGIGNFISHINGVNWHTTFYVRAYATNAVGTAYGNELQFTTTGFPNCGILTDIDGNKYRTVTIGTQCWMVENLKTTRYRNGTAIPNVTDNTAWSNLTTGAFAYYNNDASNNATYGKLYNWYAVNSGLLAPTGWHIPSDAEIQALIDYLGGNSVAGGKMKSTSSLWHAPNTGATNSSGFSGLAAGIRGGNGIFNNIGDDCSLWTSTEVNSDAAYYRNLGFDNEQAYRNYPLKKQGFSIRCIKD